MSFFKGFYDLNDLNVFNAFNDLNALKGFNNLVDCQIDAMRSALCEKDDNCDSPLLCRQQHDYKGQF